MSQVSLLTAVRASGLIAVDKPAGMTVIPGRDQPPSASLRHLLEAQLQRPMWVVHRIDRDTSGVVVFALDAESHRTASMAFEHGQVQKQYLALVQGRIEAPVVIDVPLIAARKNRMRPALPGEEGKAARTRITPLETFANATWVSAEPETGRQHQIRVHLKAIGHPLLFDHQYGRKTPVLAAELAADQPKDDVALARTPLHAAHILIPAMNFEARAPVPPDVERCLTLLRMKPAT